MKLQEILSKTIEFFKNKNFDSPRLESELLISHGLGLSRIQLYTKFDQPLKEEEITKCRELVRRRVSGEPVAYIVGEKGFFGHTFKVGPGVLIPRPETELLVEEVIHFINNILKKETVNEEIQFLDLGSGTGCIGLSLALEFKNAKVICLEKSTDALKYLKANCEQFQLQDRVLVLHDEAEKNPHEVLSQHTDQSKAFITVNSEKILFDVIVSNPPYISEGDHRVEKQVHQFEPHSALYSSEQGLNCLRTWSHNWASKLKPQSMMIFEIGLDQGAQAQQIFSGLNVFDEVKILKDLAEHDRFIIGIKNNKS